MDTLLQKKAPEPKINHHPPNHHHKAHESEDEEIIIDDESEAEDNRILQSESGDESEAKTHKHRGRSPKQSPQRFSKKFSTRPRGRKSKPSLKVIEAAATTESGIKRKRGRPRKVESDTNITTEHDPSPPPPSIKPVVIPTPVIQPPKANGKKILSPEKEKKEKETKESKKSETKDSKKQKLSPKLNGITKEAPVIKEKKQKRK